MNDHETTPEELLECALLEEIQSIKAYMEKFNAEEKKQCSALEKNG